MKYSWDYQKEHKNSYYIPGINHANGNGSIGVYGNGPHITEVYSPYTSPVLFRMLLSADEDHQVSSICEREYLSSIYRNKIIIDGEEAAVITDIVHEYLPGHVRVVRDVKKEFFLDIVFLCKHFHAFTERFTSEGYKCLEYEILPGNPIFFHTSHKSYYCMLTFDSSVQVVEDKENILRLKVSGDCTFKLSCSAEYPEMINTMYVLMGENPFETKQKVTEKWNSIVGRRKLPIYPVDSDILEMIDDVEKLIICQQSYDGGLPSSNGLPFGYSRDNYGAGRGLLAIGHYAQARAIIDFKNEKFLRFGSFQNAEAMGDDYPRHPSDNENVEQTSYITLLARDYYEVTGDDLYIKKIFPMLLWTLNTQLPYMKNNMLPFNGDETYIAGMVLPRSCMHHGAAEATLMFITAAEWLYGWAKKNSISDSLEEVYTAAKKAKQAYKDNFVINGELVANQPNREAIHEMPEYHKGVCEQGMVEGQLHFTWLQKEKNGHYLCPVCRSRGGYTGEPTPGPIVVPSVSLLPAYLKSDLFTQQELYSYAKKYMERFDPKKRLVGYDAALLLYTLCHAEAPKEEIKYAWDLTMKLRDENGSWNEYYENLEFLWFCNKNRPWESGYSLEALLKAYPYVRVLL